MNQQRTQFFRRGCHTGLTLIELLITCAIAVVVLAIVAIAMNPAQQFMRARNEQRTAHINVLAGAVRQNLADNRNTFSCAAGPIPATTTRMAIGTSSYNIASCLTPVYLPVLPHDASLPGAHFTSITDYDTGYTISRNASSGRVTVSAPGTEGGVPIISVTR